MLWKPIALIAAASLLSAAAKPPASKAPAKPAAAAATKPPAKLAAPVADFDARYPASVVSLLSYRHERKRDRPGRIARLALAFIVVQALIGLASHSAKVYLAQPVLANAAFGLAFLISGILRRPLAGMFAQEMQDFPPEVRSSATFNAIFTRISLAWGCYLLMRSASRLLSLSMSVERFLVVNLVTGLPLTAGMITWSVWYSVRSFRRSQEWGWAFEEGAQGAAGSEVAGGAVDVALAGAEETAAPSPAADPV